MMVQLVLVLDNLRSAHNVGSILRSADAAGITRVIACGTTPYTEQPGETRDPVIVGRNSRSIAKTSLGAEQTVRLEHMDSSLEAIAKLRAEGRAIYALERAQKALNIFGAPITLPAALVIGNEVDGVSSQTQAACDATLAIPQVGTKESLNVAVATGIAAYALLHPPTINHNDQSLENA